MLEGEVGFMVNGEEFVAKAGDHVAIPDGALHAFSGVSERARMLILNAPGQMHDDFFTGVGRVLPEGATEPLPPEHPYWAHPNVTVTPHIASETRAASAARVIVENIRRGEAGEPFLHLVDREAGY